MQKNLYYRDTFKRVNVFKNFFLSLFTAFASGARMTIEVFTRKNFGERYFLLSSSLSLAFLLAIIPVLIVKVFKSSPDLFMQQEFNYDTMEPTAQAVQSASGSLMPDYLTWYVFIALFIGMSIKHHLDMRHNPSVFDFEKFSLSSGEINPLFFKIRLPFIETNFRTVECLFEPAVFFLLGALLWLIGQNLGILLVIVSFLYSVNYFNDYLHGDHFVMDKIDEMILNEELEDAFVNDPDESETRGFRFRGRKPNGANMRQKLLPFMTENEEILTVD